MTSEEQKEAFIKRMMMVVSDCHYAINRMPSAMAVHTVREMIMDLKNEMEWRIRQQPHHAIPGEDDPKAHV